eukprot:m.56597 g.56597  ORF g.56597 m.56597 type:complete len:2447 (+) comp11048_c0_seq1:195-7535(+)
MNRAFESMSTKALNLLVVGPTAHILHHALCKALEGSKSISITNGELHSLQERNELLLQSNGIIVTFSLISRASFENVNNLTRTIRLVVPGIPIFAVGTHADLRTDENVQNHLLWGCSNTISTNEADRMMSSLDCEHFMEVPCSPTHEITCKLVESIVKDLAKSSKSRKAKLSQEQISAIRTCDDEATFSGNVDVQDFMRYVKNTPEIRTLRFQCEEKIYRQKDQTKYSGIGPNPAAESDVSTIIRELDGCNQIDKIVLCFDRPEAICVSHVIGFITHTVKKGKESKYDKLSLEGGLISSATFGAVAKQLYRTNIKNLEFRSCNVEGSPEIWIALSKANITSLSMHSTPSASKAALICNKNSRLKKLSLKNCVDSKILENLANDLPAMCPIESMDLSDNIDLDRIPKMLIEKCPCLDQLNISNANINSAAFAEILTAGKLVSSVRKLIVSGNKITSIPVELEGLQIIEEMDLADNAIIDIPKLQWKKLMQMKLELKNNPCVWSLPPNLADNPESVVPFLSELTEGEVRCLRTRLLILGSPATGKTAIFNALQGKPSKDSGPTVGINIVDFVASKGDKLVELKTDSPVKKGSPKLVRRRSLGRSASLAKSSETLREKYETEIRSKYEANNIHLSAWDFGSAPSNTTFVSGNGLYIIAFNASATNVGVEAGMHHPVVSIPHEGAAKEKGLDAMWRQVQFWLKTVQSTSPKPVKCVLVGTHGDKCNEKLRSEIKAFIQARNLKMKQRSDQPWPDVLNTVVISCNKSNSNLKNFRSDIIGYSMDLIQNGYRMPISFLALEDSIKSVGEITRQKSNTFLDWQRFVSLGRAFGMQDTTRMSVAATVLNKIGVLKYWNASQNFVYLSCENIDSRVQKFAGILKSLGYPVKLWISPNETYFSPTQRQAIVECSAYVIFRSVKSMQSNAFQNELRLVLSAKCEHPKYLAKVILDDSATLPLNVEMSLEGFDEVILQEDDEFGIDDFHEICEGIPSHIAKLIKEDKSDIITDHKVIVNTNWLAEALAKLTSVSSCTLLKEGNLGYEDLALIWPEHNDKEKKQLLWLVENLLLGFQTGLESYVFPLGTRLEPNFIETRERVKTHWKTMVKAFQDMSEKQTVSVASSKIALSLVTEVTVVQIKTLLSNHYEILDVCSTMSLYYGSFSLVKLSVEDENCILIECAGILPSAVSHTLDSCNETIRDFFETEYPGIQVRTVDEQSGNKKEDHTRLKSKSNVADLTVKIPRYSESKVAGLLSSYAVYTLCDTTQCGLASMIINQLNADPTAGNICAWEDSRTMTRNFTLALADVSVVILTADFFKSHYRKKTLKDCVELGVSTIIVEAQPGLFATLDEVVRYGHRKHLKMDKKFNLKEICDTVKNIVNQRQIWSQQGFGEYKTSSYKKIVLAFPDRLTGFANRLTEYLESENLSGFMFQYGRSLKDQSPAIECLTSGGVLVLHRDSNLFKTQSAIQLALLAQQYGCQVILLKYTAAAVTLNEVPPMCTGPITQFLDTANSVNVSQDTTPQQIFNLLRPHLLKTDTKPPDDIPSGVDQNDGYMTVEPEVVSSDIKSRQQRNGSPEFYLPLLRKASTSETPPPKNSIKESEERRGARKTQVKGLLQKFESNKTKTSHPKEIQDTDWKALPPPLIDIQPPSKKNIPSFKPRSKRFEERKRAFTESCTTKQTETLSSSSHHGRSKIATKPTVTPALITDVLEKSDRKTDDEAGYVEIDGIASDIECRIDSKDTQKETTAHDDEAGYVEIEGIISDAEVTTSINDKVDFAEIATSEKEIPRNEKRTQSITSKYMNTLKAQQEVSERDAPARSLKDRTPTLQIQKLQKITSDALGDGHMEGDKIKELMQKAHHDDADLRVFKIVNAMYVQRLSDKQKSEFFQDASSIFLKNTNINEIILTSIGANDFLAQHLAESLMKNTYVTSLNLESNDIYGPGMSAIAALLKQSPSLVKVRLRNQSKPIPTAVLHEIADAVEFNSKITTCSVDCRDATAKERIEKALSRNMDKARRARQGLDQSSQTKTDIGLAPAKTVDHISQSSVNRLAPTQKKETPIETSKKDDPLKVTSVDNIAIPPKQDLQTSTSNGKEAIDEDLDEFLQSAAEEMQNQLITEAELDDLLGDTPEPAPDTQTESERVLGTQFEMETPAYTSGSVNNLEEKSSHVNVSTEAKVGQLKKQAGDVDEDHEISKETISSKSSISSEDNVAFKEMSSNSLNVSDAPREENKELPELGDTKVASEIALTNTEIEKDSSTEPTTMPAAQTVSDPAGSQESKVVREEDNHDSEQDLSQKPAKNNSPNPNPKQDTKQDTKQIDIVATRSPKILPDIPLSGKEAAKDKGKEMEEFPRTLSEETSSRHDHLPKREKQIPKERRISRKSSNTEIGISAMRASTSSDKPSRHSKDSGEQDVLSARRRKLKQLEEGLKAQQDIDQYRLERQRRREEKRKQSATPP